MVYSGRSLCLKSAQVPYAPPRFPVPVARCMILDMVLCIKVVQRLFIELPWSYQSDRLSRHDMKVICVTWSTNQIDHTWNKLWSGFFRATWASMSRSPTTKVMMQVIWLCRHLQSYPFTAAIRHDPKNLRAIIVSRDPCDHKNDSTSRRGLIISLSQWSFR